MCKDCGDFEICLNIYRTKHFIVKQELSIQISDVKDNLLFSRDTFYFRTKKRDKEFECLRKNKDNINGKRIPSSAQVRKYVK